MSFSEDVKKELSQMNNYVKKEELKAELYGYILTNNVSDENTNLKFTTKNEDNIYRYNKILNNLNIKYKTDIRGKMYITIITDVINLNIEKSKDINILGKFCGKRDIPGLTSEQLCKKYDFQQADVMVLFGGSIMCGGDVLAKAMQNHVAKKYVIAGGAGHTKRCE